MIQRTCGAAGFVPAIRVRGSDFSVLTALVAAGAGVALASRLALLEGTALVSLHPLTRPVTRAIFTVSRAGTARRPDPRHLIDLLRQAAVALPGHDQPVRDPQRSPAPPGR
jgi:DNA-binding transcriptional LysR family regulator